MEVACTKYLNPIVSNVFLKRFFFFSCFNLFLCIGEFGILVKRVSSHEFYILLQKALKRYILVSMHQKCCLRALSM